MAEGGPWAASHWASARRGLKSRWWPAMEPPRRPVTAMMCEGWPVERRTRCGGATAPRRAMEMTGGAPLGREEVSPPAMPVWERRAALRSPL